MQRQDEFSYQINFHISAALPNARGLTPCEAPRLLTDPLGAQRDETEALVRLLLFLADNFDPPGLKDAIQTLVRAAFDNSIVNAIAFEDYVEAIRAGRTRGKQGELRCEKPRKANFPMKIGAPD